MIIDNSHSDLINELESIADALEAIRERGIMFTDSEAAEQFAAEVSCLRFAAEQLGKRDRAGSTPTTDPDPTDRNRPGIPSTDSSAPQKPSSDSTPTWVDAAYEDRWNERE